MRARKKHQLYGSCHHLLPEKLHNHPHYCQTEQKTVMKTKVHIHLTNSIPFLTHTHASYQQVKNANLITFQQSFVSVGIQTLAIDDLIWKLLWSSLKFNLTTILMELTLLDKQSPGRSLSRRTNQKMLRVSTLQRHDDSFCLITDLSFKVQNQLRYSIIFKIYIYKCAQLVQVFYYVSQRT